MPSFARHAVRHFTLTFWKLIYNVLEATEAFTLLVVNANTSRQFPDARRMSRMPNGSRIFCAMAYCNPVVSRVGSNENCEN
ncbi:protein of unknown function [Kyrpidia spormannii]|uniref:Uncharacterized protein n=2 Tax=Kyrpidia spormannii TaxID=2055160 RepID=A0A6F9EHY3_9BACL|nr:protein of unknown function [Kyrpidia spormannii]CAB3395945.1 protein of unknown function [Kyrpidia spormannii]